MPHTCHAEHEFVDFKRQKFAQLEFSKQSLFHFWIRTGNERPVNSEPAIYKLSAFCTMYSREAAFSKLIIIKSKARFFLKNVENAFCPACLASSYERMTRVRINKCVHPISYAR